MQHLDTSSRKRTCLLAGIVAAVLPASNAPAEEATAAARADGLEEVIVTANRRLESAQRVPIAVTAIAAQEVEALGLKDPQTLQMVVPGLVMQRISAFSTPFIRGVGSLTVSPTIETSTATYVDDVYIPSSTSALANLNSIERIEVLKGPQGTLFGRNATAGVLQVFTKDPTPQPSMDLTVGYGNLETASANLYATGALTEGLSGNIALYYSDQDEGWGHNLATGEEVGENWNRGGRAKLLFTTDGGTSFLGTAFYDKTYTQQGLLTRAAFGTRNNGGFPAPEGFYDMLSDVEPFVLNEQYGGSLKIISDFSFATLTSITAYQQSDLTYQLQAQYGDPRPIINVNTDANQRTWTQEFRLGSLDDAKLKWIVGAFFFDDSGGVDPYQFSGAVVGAANEYARTIDEQDTTSYGAFAQVTVPVFEKTNITAGVRYSDDERTMTAKSLLKSRTAPEPPYVPAVNSPQKTQYDSWTYRLSLDHQFGDNLFGYVAYNRGAKSGFFNTLLTPTLTGAPVRIAPAVKPEKLDAYTVGVKSEFFDNRLRLNAEAFYYDYKDIQLTQNTLTSPVFTNAGAATYQGIDIDLTARLIDDLTLTLGAEFMEGEYDDYANGVFLVYNPTPGGNCNFTVVPGGPLPCGGRAVPPNFDPATGTWNLKGNKTVNTPEVSVTFGAAYTLHTGFGDIDLNGVLKYTGPYYADPDNGLGQVAPSSQNNDRQDPLYIVNTSVAWHSPSEDWMVRLWGNNLTDEEYWSLGAESAPASRWNPAPPRTYGVTLTKSF
jgi:iron complex outermembrane receptor protein